VGKDVENPCISVCKLTDELCTSCGRTKDEIRKWKRMKRPGQKGHGRARGAAVEGPEKEEKERLS